MTPIATTSPAVGTIEKTRSTASVSAERGDEGNPESRNPAKRLAVDDLVPVDRMREEGFEGPALLLL